MGVNVIGRGLVVMFLVGIVYLAFMPHIAELTTNEALWVEVADSRAIALRDNALLLYYVAGILAFVVVVVWMFNASSSKGASSNF